MRASARARAREDEKATTATFGGSDVLRAAATTPLTPPPARESATDDDAGRARCDGTFAEIGPSEKKRLAALIQKCVDAHEGAVRAERERDAAVTALERERELRSTMEIERDVAVDTARALKEELAAAKERAAALAATVARLRERLQSTRGDEERMGMGRIATGASWSKSDDFDVPTPRGTLTLSPVASEAPRREYSVDLLELIESVERESF